MRILLISLSVGGALGDGFKVIAKDLGKCNDIAVVTNYKITSDDVETDKICQLHFDKNRPLDFINPKNYIKAKNFITHTQYDACLVYSPHPANIFIYRWLNKNVTCAWVHDHYHHSGIGFANLIVQKANHYLFYKKSSKIIVACNYIKEDILRRELMTDASKIEVCELGLLDNLCFPISEPTENIDVLFFGRIKYYKGLDILIEAANKLTNAKFVIAGKGNLEKDCKVNNLPKNCNHINSYISDDELAKLIQRSKIIVFPYRDATGTQTVQSVFYYKKPIVATRVGCFPEYVSNGKDGLIVEPENPKKLADALAVLLQDENMRKTFGENGHKKIYSKFSNDRIARRIEQILKSNL